MKSGIGVIENISFPGKDPALTYDAVVVGAGQMLSSLCMAALENSLTGLEFAYGIPGTVGGAVYMNAGAYGGEMKDVLASVLSLIHILVMPVIRMAKPMRMVPTPFFFSLLPI